MRTDIDIRHAHTCKCGNTYFKFSTLQNKCVKCLAAKGKKLRAKIERKEWRTRREKLKTRSDHLRETQIAFNTWIRARDDGQPCISCGAGDRDCKRNAGHYLSVGSRPELRFHEDNCHGQCERCNTYLSGNQILFRAGLVEKIGLECVELLEAHHSPKKHTIEDLKALKAKYRALTKQLKASSC